MKDGLYHKEIGLPQGAAQPFIGQWTAAYSPHAKLEAVKDRYHRIDLAEILDVESPDIVEVEIRDGQPVKAVIRLAYDNSHDVVLAILRPCLGVALVKTVWLNELADSHKTLRRGAYVSCLN